MNDKPMLAPHLVCLGQALAPVLGRLEGALAETIVPTVPVASMEAYVHEGFGAIRQALSQLVWELNGAMSAIAASDDASVHDVYRAVGRFEAPLDDLIRRYRSMSCQLAHGHDRVGRDALLGTYRHLMREIQSWLRDLVDTLHDPSAALRRKGLPTKGPVTIPLTLTLTAAPDLARLQQWCEDQSPSFWEKAGGLALGALIASAFF